MRIQHVFNYIPAELGSATVLEATRKGGILRYCRTEYLSHPSAGEGFSLAFLTGGRGGGFMHKNAVP